MMPVQTQYRRKAEKKSQPMNMKNTGMNFMADWMEAAMPPEEAAAGMGGHVGLEEKDAAAEDGHDGDVSEGPGFGEKGQVEGGVGHGEIEPEEVLIEEDASAAGGAVGERVGGGATDGDCIGAGNDAIAEGEQGAVHGEPDGHLEEQGEAAGERVDALLLVELHHHLLLTLFVAASASLEGLELGLNELHLALGAHALHREGKEEQADGEGDEDDGDGVATYTAGDGDDEIGERVDNVWLPAGHQARSWWVWEWRSAGGTGS